ncbi:MAG: hypothetical protein Q9174_002757 [Haloplaca sp. 1 TL-2023]
MPSPTRPLRRSPPRRPLHERSDSEANERAPHTSRLSGDLETSFVKSTPYPTQASHILSPSFAARRGLGPTVFEDDQNAPSWATNQPGSARVLQGQSDKDRKKPGVFQDVENDHGTSVRPLSIGNPLPIAVPPLNFNPSFRPTQSPHGMEEQADDGSRISDEIVQLPTVFTPPSTSDPNSGSHSTQPPVAAKSSDNSLSSSESTGTIVRHKVRPSRGSYSAFPPVSRPNSSKSSGSPSTPQRAFPTTSDDGVSVSPISPNSATFRAAEDGQSEPALVSRPHRAVSDTVNFQFPVVKQPAVSGSWAESSNDAQEAPAPRLQRKLERTHDRWNPHLSTVPSELTEERSSDGMFMPSPLGMSTSSLDVSHHQPSHLAVPQQQRDMTGSTIRMVNESDDNVSNLLSPIPGSRGSAFYSVLSGGSRSKRKSVGQPRPTSKGSFFRDSIPAWAKVYYARSNSALALAGGRPDPNPAASSDSLAVRRTRPKPNVNIQNPGDRNSMGIELAQSQGTVLAGAQGESRQTVSQIWSPHLWHDRRSVGRRRSVFRAPSLDQHAEGPFGRRNVQVLLFTVGFVFPLAWFAAAMLPLPRQHFADSKESAAGANVTHDLEKTLGMVDEARYENARWWRNLNRLMCIVGVLIIAAIIALAVVATRT